MAGSSTFIESALRRLIQYSPGEFKVKDAYVYLLDRMRKGEVFASFRGEELSGLLVIEWLRPRKHAYLRLLWADDRESMRGLLRAVRSQYDDDCMMDFQRVRTGLHRTYLVKDIIERLTYGQ